MTTSERPCRTASAPKRPQIDAATGARHCTAHRPRSTVCTVGMYVCFPPVCLPICSLQEPSPAAALLDRDNRDTNALGQYIHRWSSCPRIYPHISLTNRPSPSPSLSTPHSSLINRSQSQGFSIKVPVGCSPSNRVANLPRGDRSTDLSWLAASRRGGHRPSSLV